VTFVEVLDRRGHVHARARVESLPFRIGRAYHNDLILDDPYVSPVHVQIEGEPASLVLRDLDSENGVQAPGGHLQADGVRIELPCDFRVGRTRLRLRDARHVVAPTLSDPAAAGRWARLAGQPLAGVLVLLAVAVVSFGEEIDKGAPDLGHIAENLLTGTLLTAVWVGLWSLITRVLTPQTRFVSHWIVAGSYALFQAGLRWAGTWVRFFVASIVPVQLLEIALQRAAASLLFYVHIALTGALRGPRRALLAVLLSAAFVSFNQLDTVFRRPDWVQVLPYWSRLQPLDPAWLATQDVDDFFEGTAGVRDAVDALARRATPPQSKEDTP
jgi:hypothetical protein